MKTAYKFSDVLRFISESFDLDQWNVEDSSNDNMSGDLQHAMKERVAAFRKPDLKCYYHFSGGKKRYNSNGSMTQDGIYLRLFNKSWGTNKISFNKNIGDVVDYIILPDITPIASTKIYFNKNFEGNNQSPKNLGYYSERRFQDLEGITEIGYREIFEYDTEFITNYDDLIQYCPDEILTVEIYFQKGSPKRSMHGNVFASNYPPVMCQIEGDFEVILRNAFNYLDGPNLDITLPRTVKKICTHAFSSNFGIMKYIYIPKSVTSIEKEAFDRTGVQYILGIGSSDYSQQRTIDYCERICKKLNIPRERMDKEGLTITIPKKFEKRLYSLFNIPLSENETSEEYFQLNKNIELNLI